MKDQELRLYLKVQIIEPAFEAILGQSSAHSLATGPVTADPFISPFGFTITPALSTRYNSTQEFWNKLTFEVEIVAFPSSIRFTLSNDDSWHNLLSEIGLTLLD